MTWKKVQLHYYGSKGWLIFWLIFLFPVGIILLFTACEFDVNGNVYSVRYDGSRGWLCFWSIVFFPVAVVLGMLNGFSFNESRPLIST